ncbi:hypothetical protein E2C01_012974 [Portunus trituberculatus]|uniref:Uncharacterized protein n=1 Tax=Portunus trituberculatus TaxID=210409 RepID=A0A5B7DFL7_PORTR|nr:hypothetical protein [Portunus trituberculatus]
METASDDSEGICARCNADDKQTERGSISYTVVNAHDTCMARILMTLVTLRADSITAYQPTGRTAPATRSIRLDSAASIS